MLLLSWWGYFLLPLMVLVLTYWGLRLVMTIAMPKLVPCSTQPRLLVRYDSRSAAFTIEVPD